MTNLNCKGEEQLSIGKLKHTNMPTQAPPSDGGPPGSFIGKTRTQYDTTGGLERGPRWPVECQAARRAPISLEGAERQGDAGCSRMKMSGRDEDVDFRRTP